MVTNKEQMSLMEVVKNLNNYDENHTIYTTDYDNWSSASSSIVCENPDDSNAPIKIDPIKYDYFLEVFIAKEFLENLKGNLEEKCERLIYYAKNDA